jgi:CubicO group peptidase (beta-lactamase class C family)
MMTSRALLLWALALGVAAGAGNSVCAAVPPLGEDVRRTLTVFVESQFGADEPGAVVLVARGAEVLLSAAYGLADVEGRRALEEDQPLPIGSLTKSFTAGAILKLVQDGVVALDDDVRKHVPDAPVNGRRVTIEQLLTHTSGMPNLVDVPGFLEWAREPRSTAELLGRTRGLPFRFEPGSSFAYSDSGYILLGAVLERHHAGAWFEAVRDLVARPLGLSSVSSAAAPGSFAARGYQYSGGEFVLAEAIDWSVPHASGALVAAADDLLAWVRAWPAGSVAGPALTPRAWAARVLPDGTHSGYAFGWKRCDFEGRQAIQHGGWVPGFTASVLHLPDDDLTAIALLNSTDRVEATYLTRRTLRLLLSGSSELALSRLDANAWSRLAGRYQTAAGSTWTVNGDENGLGIELGGPRVELEPLSPTRWCAAGSDGTWCFSFELDGSGPAESVTRSLTCEPQGMARRVE